MMSCLEAEFHPNVEEPVVPGEGPRAKGAKRGGGTMRFNYLLGILMNQCWLAGTSAETWDQIIPGKSPSLGNLLNIRSIWLSLDGEEVRETEAGRSCWEGSG